MTMEDQRARARAHIAEPVITEGMSRAEREAEWDRHVVAFQAMCKRLDEEHLLLGIGRTAAVSMTHELIWSWDTATASRWWFALPERYMTPDSMRRPDWDHSHYLHDAHGRIGRRVTTRQRPETEADTEAERMVSAILADLGDD